MPDTRLVQTAVLASPDADLPVILPTDFRDVDAFRAHHAGSRFWCGVLLGGCGRELVTKRYEDRLCHFAHLADVDAGPSACSRGAHSADHLYVRRAVTAWLHGLGHHVDGELRGLRNDEAVDFPLPDGPRLRFHLAPLTAQQWKHEDGYARGQGERIQWLLAHPGEAEDAAFDAGNPALLMRCVTAGSTSLPERRVQIGTRAGQDEPSWDALEDCVLEDRGHLRTPALRARGLSVPARRRPVATDTGHDRAPWSPPVPKPRLSLAGSRRPELDAQEVARAALRIEAVEVTGRLRLVCSDVPRNPDAIQRILDEASAFDARLRLAGTHHQPLTDAIRRAEELLAQSLARLVIRESVNRANRLAEQLRRECLTVPLNVRYVRTLLTEALELREHMQRGTQPESLTLAIRRAAALLAPSPPEIPKVSQPSPRLQTQTPRPMGLLREPSAEEADLGHRAREALIAVASERARVTWEQLCVRMQRPDLVKARRETIFQILRAADREPDGRERPLLSALLTESDPPQDADNFIRIARDHRRFVPPGPDHRVRMQMKEIAAIYAHWKSTAEG